MSFDRNYRLIDDQPLDSASLFNFGEIVEVLTGFITNPSNVTPLSICIDGGWGTGKTSLMRTLIARMTKANPEVATVFFEPWKLGDEQQVIAGLVGRVLEVVKGDAGFFARGQIELDGGSVFRMLSQRVLDVPADSVSAFHRWPADARGSFLEVEAVFRRIAKAYLAADVDRLGAVHRMVVFIDDLDRCQATKIIQALEAVKLFFDLPGFVFVFGMDRSRIVSVVEESYPDFDRKTARAYLDKMFQLVFEVPSKNEAQLIEFMAQQMAGFDMTAPDRAIMRLLARAFGKNLRQLKLFLNDFNFQRHIVRRVSDIPDEVVLKWFFLKSAFPE